MKCIVCKREFDESELTSELLCDDCLEKECPVITAEDLARIDELLN